MKKPFLFLAVFAAACTASFTTFAQPSPGSSAPGMSASLVKLFGSNTACSAMCDVKVVSSNETMSFTMNFALLDGRMRAEVDMTRIKSQKYPPEAMAYLKQMGMDQIISILRPDLKLMYIVYPSLKSYAKMPLSKDDAAALEKEPTIEEKTELGRETLDGHPCVKNKVIITMRDGEKHESLVWNATDLKDFPLQIQMTEEGSTMSLAYRQIQFTRPDAKQFEPPAGLTGYDDLQKLMAAAAEKMMKQMQDGAK